MRGYVPTGTNGFYSEEVDLFLVMSRQVQVFFTVRGLVCADKYKFMCSHVRTSIISSVVESRQVQV